jgi:hypothetical protein
MPVTRLSDREHALIMAALMGHVQIVGESWVIGNENVDQELHALIACGVLTFGRRILQPSGHRDDWVFVKGARYNEYVTPSA